MCSIISKWKHGKNKTESLDRYFWFLYFIYFFFCILIDLDITTPLLHE
jgi:hypothetical protein